MDKPAAPLSARVRHAGSGLGLATGAVTAAVWQLWPSGGWAGWQLLGTLGAACLTGGLLGAWWSRQVLRQIAPPAADRTDSEWPPTLLAPADEPAHGPAHEAGPQAAARGLAALSSDAMFESLSLPLIAHAGPRILAINPAARALWGVPDAAPLLQQPLPALFQAGDARARVQAVLEQLTAPSGSPGAVDGPALCSVQLAGDTAQRVVQMRSMRVPLLGPQGMLSWLIPAESLLGQSLTSSQALLSHLVATSPDVITLTDLQTGRYVMVNPTFERITGLQAAEVLGRTSGDLGIWHDSAERQRLVEALRDRDTAQNLPATFRVRDGQLLHMQLSASRFTHEGSEYLVINARDITRAEQLRREYAAVLDTALFGIAVTRDAHFQMVNPRFEAMLGWPAGRLQGMHASQVWPTPTEHAEARARLLPRLEAGEHVDEEVRLKRRDGSLISCRLLAQAVHPQYGERDGIIWMAEDITERRQMDQDLARARDQAEAANRAKSTFLANTSHELRTPLNALLGLARLARDPGVDELRRRQYIEKISDSAETLSAIISDILDLSKIEAGKMHLDRLPFRLDGLLQNLHEAYGALADTKGLTMRLQRDSAVPDVVVGDPVRVRQILSNYLNNALKYTRTGGVVLAVHVLHGPMLRFEVIDTGTGIDAQAQSRLFTPFTQVDSPVNRRNGGTGLGLSICRELARLMGGEVGVMSEPGHGSCFWAELPLPEASDVEIDSSTGSDGLDPIQGARILMVEDNPVNMMISVALLEQWGAVVEQAQDGLEAIHAVDRASARGQPFDLVLMDVQMPGMGGHEATRELRKRYPPQLLPIVALTAAALISEREEALGEGMNDFLTKPIDPHRLRTALVRLLRSTQASNSP